MKEYDDSAVLEGWLGVVSQHWEEDQRSPLKIVVQVLCAMPGRGWQLSELARRVGRSRGWLNAYLNTHRFPTEPVIELLGRGLGVGPGTFGLMLRLVAQAQRRHNEGGIPWERGTQRCLR